MEITPIYCHPYLGMHARNRFRKKTAYFFIVKSVISAGHGTTPVLKHREVEDPRCFRRNHRITDEGLPRFEFNCRQRTGDFLRLRRLTTHGTRDLPFFPFPFDLLSKRSIRGARIIPCTSKATRPATCRTHRCIQYPLLPRHFVSSFFSLSSSLYLFEDFSTVFVVVVVSCRLPLLLFLLFLLSRRACTGSWKTRLLRMPISDDRK